MKEISENPLCASCGSKMERISHSLWKCNKDNLHVIYEAPVLCSSCGSKIIISPNHAGFCSNFSCPSYDIKHPARDIFKIIYNLEKYTCVYHFVNLDIESNRIVSYKLSVIDTNSYFLDRFMLKLLTLRGHKLNDFGKTDRYQIWNAI